MKWNGGEQSEPNVEWIKKEDEWVVFTVPVFPLFSHHCSFITLTRLLIIGISLRLEANEERRAEPIQEKANELTVREDERPGPVSTSSPFHHLIILFSTLSL